ncbi:MAG: class I SAM-dependent methyltransferase [Candidatus Heimdallarchaeota archaeon]
MIRDDWETLANSWTSLIRPEGTLHHRFILNPCIDELLEPISGFTILDAGCGEGYLARKLAFKGAKIIGIDFSTLMIEKCKEAIPQQLASQLEYYCADIRQMPFLADDSVDKILANLCFPNLETSAVREALAEFQRVLRSTGCLVFSILHPCFEAGLGGWEPGEKNSSGRREGKFFKADHYFLERSYEQLWKNPEGPFPQPLAFVHRTLETYFALLTDASFSVDLLREPKPIGSALKKYGKWFEKETRVPFFLVFRCKPQSERATK